MRPHPTLILALLLAAATGCALSPIQKVSIAEQTYTETAANLTTSIESGLITDPDTLKGIKALAEDTNKELDKAKAAAIAGSRLQFDLRDWPRASASLDRWLLEYARLRKKQD